MTESTPVALEPLRCSACDAAVPLAPGAHTKCPYCGASVAVPARYREVLAQRSLETKLRHELETRFASVATPPPRRVDVIAVVLVLVLPSVAAVAWMALARRTVDAVSLFSVAIVPAMLPGTAVWLWSAAVHATIVRFRLALALAPPARAGGPGLCRECGAPLAVPPDALSARCPYCGTDNLVADVSAIARRLSTALGKELRTLDDAAASLRLRRRLLVIGAIAAVALFGLVIWAALFNYRHLSDPGS